MKIKASAVGGLSLILSACSTMQNFPVNSRDSADVEFYSPNSIYQPVEDYLGDKKFDHYNDKVLVPFSEEEIAELHSEANGFPFHVVRGDDDNHPRRLEADKIFNDEAYNRFFGWTDTMKYTWNKYFTR